MRNFLINRFCMPALDWINGTELTSYLEYLERSQWFDLERIQEIQNEKLKRLIKYSYESVPMYRELMKASKLTPDDIKTTDDLQKLPMITKDQLKENTPNRTISDRFQLKKLIPRYTSGSTGEPLKFYITRKDKIMKRAAFARFWRWAGWDFGSKFVNIVSAPNTIFQKNKFLSSLESFLLGQKFISAGGLVEPVYLHNIVKYNPQFIHGYSSAIYCLAEYAKTKGVKLKLRGILTSCETLLPRYRRSIQDVFGTKVYDEYGGEDMTFMAQCEEAHLYHANAENVFIELVKDGERVKPGEVGEVLITNLNRYAMPFIRYKVGDLARQAIQPCACGRGLPTYEGVEGRISDIIVTTSGQKRTVGSFVVIFEYIQEVKMFQIVQCESDRLLIKVVPEVGFDSGTEERILHGIEDIVGPEMRLELEVKDKIETTKAGKRRICISEI